MCRFSEAINCHFVNTAEEFWVEDIGFLGDNKRNKAIADAVQKKQTEAV
jgi:hypothetical protein